MNPQNLYEVYSSCLVNPGVEADQQAKLFLMPLGQRMVELGPTREYGGIEQTTEEHTNLPKCGELGSMLGDQVFTRVWATWSAPGVNPDMDTVATLAKARQSWQWLRTNSTFAFFVVGWWGGPPARCICPLGWLDGPHPLDVEWAVGHQDLLAGYLRVHNHIPLMNIPLVVTIHLGCARKGD